MPKSLTNEEVAKIADMWNDNTAEEIGKAIGRPASTVNNTAKKIRDASGGELCKKKGGVGASANNAIASLVASKTKLSKEEALENIDKAAKAKRKAK